MTKFIEPYNPNWKIEFEKINQVIKAQLNGLEIDIQHVGSTAISGLIAKPILDIDIIINNKRLIYERGIPVVPPIVVHFVQQQITSTDD